MKRSYPHCSLDLPEGWGDQTVISFALMEDSGYRANLRVEMSGMDPSTSALEALERELAALKRAPIKGFKILKKESRSTENGEGALLEYAYYQDPPPGLSLNVKTIKFRQRVYYLPGEDRLARVVCTDLDEHFLSHEADFESILESFQLS